jgi:retron-type reverse transcriptase
VEEPRAGEGQQSSAKRASQGTPQGGVISPLLSNSSLKLSVI